MMTAREVKVLAANEVKALPPLNRTAH
jgi:hypothetical protein